MINNNLYPSQASSSNPCPADSPQSYSVFTFNPQTPIDDFYFATFANKLAILTSAIEKAGKIISNGPSNPEHRNILVGPEYLFIAQDHERHGHYTKDEKNCFKEQMLELSKKIDLIIAPGTFSWWSRSDSGEYKYRNNIYIFYRGEVQHYNKHHPHVRDYRFHEMDGFYSPHYELCQSYGTAKRGRFVSKPGQDSVVLVANRLIGLEVCFDNVMKELNNHLQRHPEKRIDLHLLFSDGIDYSPGEDNVLASYPMQNQSYLSIHVDRDTDESLPNQKAGSETFHSIPSPERQSSSLDVKCSLDSVVDENGAPVPSLKEPLKLCTKAAIKTIHSVPVEEGQRSLFVVRRYFYDSANNKEGDFVLAPEESGNLSEINPVAAPSFNSEYPEIEQLLVAREIDRAIKKAQKIVTADNTYRVLSDLYNVFEKHDYAFAGLQVALTLPKELQDVETMTLFYNNVIPCWIDDNDDLTSKSIDFFYSLVALAIAQSNPSLAETWARKITNDMERMHILLEIERN